MSRDSRAGHYLEGRRATHSVQGVDHYSQRKVASTIQRKVVLDRRAWHNRRKCHVTRISFGDEYQRCLKVVVTEVVIHIPSFNRHTQHLSGLHIRNAILKCELLEGRQTGLDLCHLPTSYDELKGR